jgi:hypothetical protein
MCFSAEADLVGGIVLGAVGFDAVRHVRQRGDHRAVAALPLLLAVHQLDEAFVWWGLQGRVSAEVGQVATWIYLLFAFVVLPVYVPLSVLALESPGRRRSLMVVFAGLGAVVSAALLVAMLRGPVTAAQGDHHLAYGTGLRAGGLVVAVYVLTTCGAVVLSGYRRLAVFGLVNLIAVAVLAHLAIDGFASLWCGWAAVTAGFIALHLRRGGLPGSLADALA